MINYKKWLFPDVDKKMVSAVAEDCGLDPLVVFIAFSRGLYDPYEIEHFIENELDFSDPFEYSGMYEAVERINIAIDSEEKVLIFGDYDCDGITATALLVKYLKSRGVDVGYFIPDRENEGYGISIDAIKKAVDDGYSLIITVDNGINAVKEVEYANEIGIDVIITDHHIPLDELPDAVAVVDPHIDQDNEWLFKDLCGVGVAFKLVCAVDGIPCEEMIYKYGDLVTLGTIADVVPLVSENRAIVNVGLALIRRKLNLSIRALIEVSGIKYINSGSIAFGLCPRINASGRVASAETAVKLLLSENLDDATYYANILDRYNTDRQETEARIFEDACEIIENNGYNHDTVIVVDGRDWHVGVIGIAASKLVDRYGKPCIVINCDKDRSVGSGRSISGFSLFNALNHCSDMLVKFGGHELAAGLTLKEQNIPSFRKMINQYALNADTFYPTVKIDCKIKPSALTVDAAKSLKSLEPYGAGNPVPLFAVMESTILSIIPLSNGKHIRLKLRKDNTDYFAVMFGMTPDAFGFSVGNIVDIAVTLDVNVYNDNETASVIIKHIKKSGVDEDNLFQNIFALDRLLADKITSQDAELIFPTRDDIALIFKYIKAHPNSKYTAIEYDLINTLGLGKLNVSLQVLTQLGLVICQDNNYLLSDFNGKVNLESADILKKLHRIIGGEGSNE